MANLEHKLIKVWDDDNLIKKSIDFLRTPTQKVNFPISDHTRQMVEDLLDTYKAMTCAGIAANQLGFNKSIFVGMERDREKSISEDSSQNIDEIVPEEDNYEVYINPQIDKVDKASIQECLEGCLSIPNISLMIARFDEINVRYYNVDGQVIKRPFNGFISQLFQHELDHLNGNLMFEEALQEPRIESHLSEDIKKKIIELILYTSEN